MKDVSQNFYTYLVMSLINFYFKKQMFFEFINDGLIKTLLRKEMKK